MPSKQVVSDAQNRELVEKALAYAKAQASNPSDFVQILRATYFASHPTLSRQLRVLPGDIARARSAKARQTVDPKQSIYDDPRFLKNALALASKKKSVRIIGGEKTAAGEFPDCVAVGSKTRWGCSGTLIAPSVVLSAGHCASVADRVFFGTNVSGQGTIINVAEPKRHPDYNKATDKNDLLLLLLEKPSKVTPRKIAKVATIRSAQVGRAVGFGAVDANGMVGYGTKRQVDVPIATPDCAGVVDGASDKSAYGCHTSLELVAGKPLLEQDSCSGDSGGPFYVRSGSSWQLAGATSRSSRGSTHTCGDGGIYVCVDKYREWIEDTAKIKLK
jgi:secreted trypsin-like serine protease